MDTGREPQSPWGERMPVEKDVDLVEFICPRCGHRWEREYDVRHCETPSGEVREYFQIGGVWVLPPYTPAGAPQCVMCGWRVVGRRVGRR
jgi:hypothetical protein